MVDSGSTAWILMATAMVILMTAPGLALFYGGLVSERNVLSTLMHSFFILCLISVQWVLWGYSLAFGTSIGGIVGGLDLVGLGPLLGNALEGTGIPDLAFAMFQGAFAIITVALITGAFAERINFGAFVLFALLWATLVYDPLAYWVWGGGFLMQLGVLDFAGGTVVHISSGVSALIAALVVGRRRGFPEKVSEPHNLPFTVMGASLLWFGWFGFNAGSALAAGPLAALALVTTNTAAGAAGLTWALLDWRFRGKPTVLGTATGAVAGLVAITPAAGFVSVLGALAIGVGGSVASYWGVNVLKARLGYDDTLDVFGVHGLAGTWGALATGLFATTSVNPAGADGLFYGNAAQLGLQALGVVVGWAVAAVGTFIILKVVGALVSLRVPEEHEEKGLDESLHGEVAYRYTMPTGSIAQWTMHERR